MGHAVIARKFLQDWRDIRIHWVWLPLWHVLGALVYKLGGGLQTLRYLSIALSALAPFLLVATLAEHRTRLPAPPPWLAQAERLIPFGAGVLLTLWPLGLGVGESAQPEALFQTLVLALCLTWERGRPLQVGVLLSLTALLRYEVWPLPAVLAVLWWVGRPRTLRGSLAWVLPSLAIVAWCVLHYHATHEPLQFLRINSEYIRHAWADLRLLERRPVGVRFPLFWYVAIVPWFAVRWWVLLVVPGLPWMAWRAPRSHRLMALVLLTLLTYLWVRRVNLGLHRHFAVLVPFYATAMAASWPCCVASLCAIACCPPCACCARARPRPTARSAS